MKTKLNLAALTKTAGGLAKKNAPGIFMAVGIAGMVASTVLAIKATPKAMKLIEEKKKETGKEKLTVLETVQTVGPCYIPTAISTVLGAGCLIASGTVSHKRNTALAAACALSESALTEYQAKTLETVGEKKESEIRDAVAKDRVAKNPVENKEVVLTKKGETLCYEPLSGRYFRTDIEKLRKGLNEFNQQLLRDEQLSLNDLYYEIGLEETRIGASIGWNVSEGLVDFYFSSQLTGDNEPCLVLDYKNPPKYEFNSNWAMGTRNLQML